MTSPEKRTKGRFRELVLPRSPFTTAGWRAVEEPGRQGPGFPLQPVGLTVHHLVPEGAGHAAGPRGKSRSRPRAALPRRHGPLGWVSPRLLSVSLELLQQGHRGGQPASRLLQGHCVYKNVSEDLPLPAFSPSLLGDARMLYFWFSEQVLDSLAKAAFQDGRLMLSLTGDEFKVRAGGLWDVPVCGLRAHM